MHHARNISLLLLLAVPFASHSGATPSQTPTSSGSPPAPAPPLPCALPALPLPTQTRAVIVLDTSGSMRGIGDGQANIFGKVKEAVAQYVQTAKPDQLELITFDSGLRRKFSYALPADQGRLNTDLGELQADGRNTYLYRSLQEALSPLKGSERFITNVFVLTDGIDNDRRRRETAESALAAFKGRGPLDSLTYIALGTQIPGDARQALTQSDYASGLTLPVGQPPLLTRLGTRVQRVTDAAHVPTPFPEGTTLTLFSPTPGIELLRPQVEGGQVSLHLPSRLPYGTPALLCAAPSGAGVIGARPQRVLLDLNVGQAGSGLLWLNPGADLTLAPGESTVLRYRALPGTDLSAPTTGLRLPADAQGLTARLERLPGAREFTVRFQNAGSQVARVVTPQLRLGSGRLIDLPGLTMGPGVAPAGTPDTNGRVSTGVDWGWLRWALGLLTVLALLGLALWLGPRFRRRSSGRGALGRPRLKMAAAPAPSIQGIEYRDDRTIALVTQDGEVSGVPTPLGGPFDIGLLSRVPLLSGLRAEQHRDGLKILNVPADLEVSQGGRLIQVGDEVRPGTLLGVEVARQARAPHAPLGSLVGLGLPLTLKPDGVTLHMVGPYGTHALTLRPGITDLGEEFSAPALNGLKVSPSGPNILLADVPVGMTVTRSGEMTPLKPGTYLPAETVITLPAT